MTSNRKKIQLAIIMIICVFAGIGYSWSVFQKPIVATFNWPVSAVALTFSIQVLATTTTPLLLSKIYTRIPIKHIVFAGGLIYGISVFLAGYMNSVGFLYLSFGLATGIGIGAIYPSLLTYSIRLFPDKRGLVAGLCAASVGSGSVIWAPITAYLSSQFGILNAMKGLGLLFLVAISVLTLFLEKDASIKTSSTSIPKIEETSEKNWRFMLKTPEYYLTLVLFTIGTSSGLMVISQASPILQDAFRMLPTVAALFVSFIALCNTGGRLIWGYLSDKLGRPTVLSLLFTVSVASLLLLMLQLSLATFIIGLLLIASCYGGFVAVIAPFTSDLYGTKNLSSNYGFILISNGFGAILGPQLALFLKTQSGGSYHTAFLASAILSLLGIFVVFAIHRIRQKNQGKIQRNTIA